MSTDLAPALMALLDAGGVSFHTAATRLGLREGEALAALVPSGRVTPLDPEVAKAAVRSWGRVRVILRAGACVAEVMSDLSTVRERGSWWNDEDDRTHLHLDLSAVAAAFATAKVGHGTGRAVRLVAFVDARQEVLFKVMIPKERPELIPAFNLLRGKSGVDAAEEAA